MTSPSTDARSIPTTLTTTLREREFSSFFEVPFLVYPENTPYVSPLKSDLRDMLDVKKNPFFHNGIGDGTFYTAYRGNQPVGRISCHIHHASNRRWNEQVAFFGFFDCESNPETCDETAKVLLDAAVSFARKHNATHIRGNMNLTAMQECGVVVDGFDKRPLVGQVYNPPHIPAVLARYGFQPVYPMTTFYREDLSTLDVETIIVEKHRQLLRDPEYRFRRVDLSRFDEEVEHLRVILNKGMQNNKHFVDITSEEMSFQLAPFKQIINDKIVWIAEYQGKPIGATLVAPNVLPLLQKMRSRISLSGLWHFLWGKRKLDEASIIIYAIDPAHQAKGIVGALNYHVFRSLKERGYRSLGGTWIADSNHPSLRQIGFLGMKAHHRVDLFEYKL